MRRPALAASPWLALLLWTGLSACSGKGGSADSSTDTAALPGTAGERGACAQTADPGPTVTPVTQITTQTPALQQLDSPYTVELAQDRGGYVRLTADASTAGPRRVYLSIADVITAVVDESGGEVPFSTAAGEACPEELPAHVELELAEGTVYLLFSPSPFPSVWALTSRS
jgi:hypothetical protein